MGNHDAGIGACSVLGQHGAARESSIPVLHLRSDSAVRPHLDRCCAARHSSLHVPNGKP
jgi:hypothetical protein